MLSYEQIIFIFVVLLLAYIVSKLPIPQIKDYLNIIPNTSESECVICLDKINVDDRIFELSCNHKYHIDCMVQYFNSNSSGSKCPICREQIIFLIK